jgi:RimJ/RimL family protein N-acetyltransferase
MPEPAGADLAVREVRWTDFDDLVATYYRLYDERETDPEIGITLFSRRPSHADEVRWFSELYGRVAAGGTIMRVAEIGGRVVGNCVIERLGPSDDSEMAHVGVLGLLVDRSHRSHGVGTALLGAALEAARGKFDLVRLSVFSSNERARRLYERFGFVPYGHLPASVRRGGRYLDLDLMWRDLRGAHANR